MRLRSLASIGLVVGGCNSSAGEVSDQPIGDPGAGGDAGSGGNGGDLGTNGASGASGSGAAGAGGSAGSDPGTGGTAGADGGLGAGGAAGSGGGDPGDARPPEPARQLALGSAGLVAITEGGHAVYRTAAGKLHAIPLAPGASPLSVAERPGTIVIKGKVVFNWASVDWVTNLGSLSFWTANAGTIDVGVTLFAEDMVAATPDGMTVVYNANVSEKAADLMIARTDFFTSSVLIPAVGRGSQDTCRARIGFVGQRLFVGYCAAGSQAATIQRFDLTETGWTSTPIASNALPGWSADQSGERVFYQSSDYRGNFAQSGQNHTVDASVSGGLMLPDGSGILYNVSDQLRRTELPQINPIPIVTRGFAQRADFSPNYEHVLYSRKVTYEGGTKRDLLLTDTRGFNPTPRELVAEPVATLSRSTFTSDSKYVLYLTDVTPFGSTLNVASVATGAVRMYTNVDTVVAARGSTIVFSDNRSDPTKYPIVADLKAVDVASDGAPTVIETKIMDGRSFYVSPDLGSVVYVRSGVDRDAADPASQGVFVRSLR
jgi:hypothetical protein